MNTPSNTSIKARVYHRYLGFFLAGIMAIYAISGVVLIFRNTNFLKKEITTEKTVALNLKGEAIGQALKIKRFKVDRQEAGVIYFKEGQYDPATGQATVTKKELPYIMGKMTHLHKATTNDPLYFLNIFFGVSLLFFVLSAFWMYRPSTTIFKNGIYFTLAGIVLTLILLFV